MFKRIIVVALMLSFCLPAMAQEADRSGAVAASERLAKLAQISLSRKDVGNDNFRQAVALLTAAVKLNPKEVRFLRLLLEAQLQLKDTTAAIATLEQYLSIQKNDQVARLQLVDLYVQQMETAEARLKYLVEDLLPNETLSTEFRAALATRAAKMYLERDQFDAASKMIDRALELNPLDPVACQMNYETLPQAAPASDRVAAILKLLRANPTQPATMEALAAELASAGMHDVAQRWYTRATELNGKTGKQLDRRAFLDAAISSFILGQAKTAEGRTLLLIADDPDNFDAQIVNLLSARKLGGETQMTDALAKTTDSVVRRMNALHEKLAGAPSPTTKPAGELAERIPDVAADAAAVKEKGDAALSEAYAQGLTDLAYISLYFANKPADAEPLMAALRTVLPENSVVMTRLEGWHLLQTGKADEAKAKLETIADRDPLSKLGLIKITAATDKAAAATEAQALLNAHPSGLLGALLIEALADLEVRVEPQAELVNAINAELAKFPMKWLDINESPSDFYSLTATVGKVPFAFGEPMIATVTIKNLSNFDIPLGPSGTLRPELWFDCAIKAGGQPPVPAVTFERFGQKLVLRPAESIEHVCRIDQGQLWAGLHSNPAVSFPLIFTVFTNPVPAAAMAAPGPAGYRATMRTIERQATPIMADAVRGEVFKKLNIGEAQDRIRISEMLAQFIQLINNAPNPEQAAETVRQLREAVEQGMSDNDPLVRAWTTYITTATSTGDRQAQLADKMAASKDPIQRLLVGVLIETLPAEVRDRLLPKLAEDEDAQVKELARATRDYFTRVPAATQPAATPPAEGGN